MSNHTHGITSQKYIPNFFKIRKITNQLTTCLNHEFTLQGHRKVSCWDQCVPCETMTAISLWCVCSGPWHNAAPIAASNNPIPKTMVFKSICLPVYHINNPGRPCGLHQCKICTKYWIKFQLSQHAHSSHSCSIYKTKTKCYRSSCQIFYSDGL